MLLRCAKRTSETCWILLKMVSSDADESKIVDRERDDERELQHGLLIIVSVMMSVNC